MAPRSIKAWAVPAHQLAVLNEPDLVGELQREVEIVAQSSTIVPVARAWRRTLAVAEIVEIVEVTAAKSAGAGSLECFIDDAPVVAGEVALPTVRG